LVFFLPAPLVAFFTTFLATGALAAGAFIAFSAGLGAMVSVCLCLDAFVCSKILIIAFRRTALMSEIKTYKFPPFESLKRASASYPETLWQRENPQSKDATQQQSSNQTLHPNSNTFKQTCLDVERERLQARSLSAAQPRQDSRYALFSVEALPKFSTSALSAQYLSWTWS